MTDKVEYTMNLLNNKFANTYPRMTIWNTPCFVSNKNVGFHLVRLGNGIVVEYMDTMEDGDMYYPSEYKNEESLFTDLVKEIEG